MKPVILRTLAVIAMLAMLASALLSLAVVLLSAAPAPCAEGSQAYTASLLLRPASLTIGALGMGFVLRRPRWWSFAAALAIPAAALAFHWAVAADDARAQQQCRAETLQQAVARCRVDLKVYRPGRDSNGYRTLTLVAPGETDRAWNCLERWAMYNGKVSIQIDESVYEQYRARHGKR